jgi:hypothetical protein
LEVRVVSRVAFEDVNNPANGSWRMVQVLSNPIPRLMF